MTAASADLGKLDSRLRAAEVWSAEHDGRSKTFWEDQHQYNKANTAAVQAIADRTNRLEKRLIWVVGFCAGAGGLFGFSVSKTMGLF